MVRGGSRWAAIYMLSPPSTVTDGTGGEAGEVIEKAAHDVRRLVGTTEALHGDPTSDRSVERRIGCVGHAGLGGRSGDDEVHRGAGRRHLGGQRLDQSEQAGLARRVSGTARATHRRGDRRDHDDAAVVGGRQVGQRGAHDAEHATEVRWPPPSPSRRQTCRRPDRRKRSPRRHTT